MDKTLTANYTAQVKQKLIASGADLAGVADAEPLKALKTDPPNLLDSFTRALSMAVQLPAAVFEMIEDQPTPIYDSVYQTANRILDEITFKTAQRLQNDGFRSLPIPASQVLDMQNWYAAISHKAVARMAGLGWQGKNLLLITPKYGSRVRLATVLTDAPLIIDGPVKNRCGNCMMCSDACPAGAIKGINTENHYKTRNEAMHFDKCAAKLDTEFARLPKISAQICGICIKVCPFGRKFGKRSVSRKHRTGK